MWPFKKKLVRVVPEGDYQLLKQTNWVIAKGGNMVITANRENKDVYSIAQTLHDYYGATEMELLTELGVWIPGSKKKVHNV